MADQSIGVGITAGGFLPNGLLRNGRFELTVHVELDAEVFFNPWTGEWAASLETQLGPGYGGGGSVGIEGTIAPTGSPWEMTHGTYWYGEVEIPGVPNFGYEHGADGSFQAGTISMGIGPEIGPHFGFGQDMVAATGGNFYDWLGKQIRKIRL